MDKEINKLELEIKVLKERVASLERKTLIIKTR